MGSNSCLNFAITHHCVYLSPSFSPNSKLHNPNPNHNQFLLSRSSFIPIATSSFALHSNHTLSHPRSKKLPLRNAPNFYVAASAKAVPLKVMISGAPASGKGTQCELITQKYGLVHIAAGDLLRVEVAAASENGKRAKEYMEKGELVPDEIVVMVPEDNLVERVVGRRLDPLTGKIYHLKYSPPESEEIASRLTQRFDDTEERVKLRLHTHHQNVEAVLSTYKDITVKVNGNVAKENVFAQIDAALTELLEQREVNSGSLTA
ncbi:adenylate kinase, chloroplastic-like isoform X4 [Durio zibethinus]|uniref:adenylate kinase n=1 Tax=Durio zibethinus TaxID=66656 RepID=A0A6P5WVG6_DURZI|nr:adenylate kinase, chloroplastic-like isoform X4 [Durio zibethinus]